MTDAFSSTNVCEKSARYRRLTVIAAFFLATIGPFDELHAQVTTGNAETSSEARPGFEPWITEPTLRLEVGAYLIGTGGDAAVGVEGGRLAGFSAYLGVGVRDALDPLVTATVRWQGLIKGKYGLSLGIGSTVGEHFATTADSVGSLWWPDDWQPICLHGTCSTGDGQIIRARPGVWINVEAGLDVPIGDWFHAGFRVGRGTMLNDEDLSCDGGPCSTDVSYDVGIFGGVLSFEFL